VDSTPAALYFGRPGLHYQARSTAVLTGFSCISVRPLSATSSWIYLLVALSLHNFELLVASSHKSEKISVPFGVYCPSRSARKLVEVEKAVPPYASKVCNLQNKIHPF